MQFQLPQFIETEDKIVGPFTLKQFIFLVGAGGVAVFAYFVFTPIISFFVAVPIIALGVALGFVRINGQPFSRIGFAALRYYWLPQIYVW